MIQVYDQTVKGAIIAPQKRDRQGFAPLPTSRHTTVRGAERQHDFLEVYPTQSDGAHLEAPVSETPQESTSVYRYYDKNKILIYVGITKQRTGRNRQHNADKEWWPFVASQEVEHHVSRLCARNRERELIKIFRPPFNRVHNKDHVVLRLAYLGLSVVVDTAPDDNPKKRLMDNKYRIGLEVTSFGLFTRPEDASIVRMVKLAPSRDYRQAPVLLDGKQIGCLIDFHGDAVLKFNWTMSPRSHVPKSLDGLKTGFVKLVPNIFKKSRFELFVKSVHIESSAH